MRYQYRIAIVRPLKFALVGPTAAMRSYKWTCYGRVDIISARSIYLSIIFTSESLNLLVQWMNIKLDRASSINVGRTYDYEYNSNDVDRLVTSNDRDHVTA